MEEKEIVTNDASKQKEASNTEEVKQLVDKSNAEEETAENAEKETTETAEEESTENAEEETTETTEEEEKEENEKKREDVDEYREMEEKNREEVEEYEMGLITLFEEVESDIEVRPTKISGADCVLQSARDWGLLRKR
ncbi:hypothetical protein Pcinc_022723 [Petrolisthes cinctipes]|uniref:Uncharacterized protein n=1 Tax=Petrolisthes cinctipes TaxID=88211 RepID=A0AAE1FF07_PETCI|nr:hypothetical protein Pcinc_022723 [Petrolisthes cinctipes]